MSQWHQPIVFRSGGASIVATAHLDGPAFTRATLAKVDRILVIDRQGEAAQWPALEAEARAHFKIASPAISLHNLS